VYRDVYRNHVESSKN